MAMKFEPLTNLHNMQFENDVRQAVLNAVNEARPFAELIEQIQLSKGGDVTITAAPGQRSRDGLDEVVRSCQARIKRILEQHLKELPEPFDKVCVDGHSTHASEPPRKLDRVINIHGTMSKEPPADGVYRGLWSGSNVWFETPDESYNGQSEPNAIKGINVPCIVGIHGAHTSVQLDGGAAIAAAELIATAKSLVAKVLNDAQALRIQQVQACAEANWSPLLKAKGDAAWTRINGASELLSRRLDNLSALISQMYCTE